MPTGDNMRQRLVVIASILFLLMGSFEMATARDKSGVLKGSQLIGMNVEGTDGKKLGDVKDIVVDPMEGDIDYVVLDYGGFLGLGDKYFAVPWEVVQFSDDGKKLMLDVTKKDLKQAPGFDKKNWPDLSSREQAVVIYEFYGVPLTDGGSKPPKGQAPTR